MDRTFSYSFDPPSEDPVPGTSVVLSVGDIEEAGIREVLQSPGAALSTWALLDALLEPTGAGTPFQFREPLGQSREVKVALSGLFGRFVARAYLQRYFNSSIFTHLGKTEISLDGRRTLKVRKKIKGDLPDWILCDGAFSNLTVAEAKGCHDQPGPAKALGRAWAQANRIEIIQGGRRATLKRVAIATRWGSKIGGEPDPIISVRDPVEQGDFTEEENQAALIGLSRLHVANLTKRDRKRKLADGTGVVQTRWVLNYREPRSGQRRQLFFEKQKDAQARRNQIIAEIETGTHSDERNRKMTIRQIADRWIANRTGEIKEVTLDGYRLAVANIVGPLLVGSPLQRAEYTATRIRPEGTKTIPLLGEIRVQDLTTSEIRSWHKTLATEVGWYSANRAKMILVSVLALAAEDLNIRPPAMPTNLGRGRTKEKKTLLTTEQISAVIKNVAADREKGLYVAFPFLAGTRPSEQLGLLWEDIDFDANTIRIRRMQERDGSITNFTKTVAGTREVPVGKLLRSMLLDWRLACPRRDGELYRVFPGLGTRQQWPLPRIGGGGPLLYWNFRRRFWVSTLKKLGLPIVTPHSARHSFISTLQAQGIEVGLVARIAGHSNANVTLGHYTQAVRGGESAAIALESAFLML